ncbi:hypothetical protein Mgra_00007448 [Meloidogyne graminicola]|uniref:RNA helicase n=1 Tax=Meloidogyne graminicola TaxID=189291 RepID=A0A8S9ZIL9_9BILA|nr:hypothetical protein Mgra_00007448 [Meloidogyne graminicola]
MPSFKDFTYSPNLLYYEKLVEMTMSLPTRRPDTMAEQAWIDLQKLYTDANSYLQMEFNSNPEVEQYIKKFEHFVHLFFAYEKFDLESKFVENATVIYVEHRRPRNPKGRQNSTAYGVYKFKMTEDTLEELVVYAKVLIDNKHLGSVTYINRDDRTIEVAFEDAKGQIMFDNGQRCTIDIEFNDRQYRSCLRSLELLKKGKGTFAIFPDAKELISYENYQRTFNHHYQKNIQKQLNNKFDKMQNQAIYSIVTGVHGTVPFVLWGPPGTGKTVTIIECVNQLLQDPLKRILICTPSNMAADLIAKRIYQMRILSPKQMRRYYSLGKSINDRDRDLDPIIKMENCALFGITDERFKLDSFKEIVEQNIRLFFTTLSCSAYLEDNITEPDFFSHIFIDEASQSFEPETLIPVTRFATENTRVILCGDYQQLGAVCKPYFLKIHKQICSSLMERLMTTKIKDDVYVDGRTYCKLNESYRCHPRIIEFSSVNFYSGELVAVREKERIGFCQWKYLPRKNFPLILHVVSKGTEVAQTDGGRSFHNMEEVDVVLKYIKLINETMIDVKDEEIGVISPYKQQTQKIREKLCHRSNITIDSVESFQGSERRIIIISLSRSEQLGFLSEYKRINTSFTRAKELLIVIISQSFINLIDPIKRNSYWKKFIHFCIENDAVTIDKFAGENGEITKEEMDTFKERIMESMNMNLKRVERPGPRVKQSTSPQADESEEEAPTNKTIPPRKLHGVNPTSLFKKSNDKNVNKLANAKNTNGKNKANVDKNKDNTEWLSDDEEAGTDYWAKHFAACEPSNERPYKSFCDPFNAADFSDDEDVPTNNKSSDNKEIQTILIQNTQKSFNEHKLEDQPTSSNSIKNAIKKKKPKRKDKLL